MKFVARRVAHAMLLLAGVSVLSFLFAGLAPGDYFSGMRLDPRISGGTVQELRSQSGTARPLPVRYAQWAACIVRGDFGYSLAYSSPVGPLVWERVRATLLLTSTATLIAWLLAIPIGIWNAANRGTWRDNASRVLLAGLLAIPDLLLAIVFLLFAAASGWFPTGGMMSPEFATMSAFRKLADLAWHLALPAGVLVVGIVPVLIRHVRAAMAEAMDAPFAISVRAQGIPRARRLWRHLLPAAANPLVSLFGLSLGTLLSASLLVEVVTGWPGLGPLFLEAIMARDFAVVLAVIMLSTTFLVSGNLVADLLLYRLDPRIRTSER